MRAEPAHRGGAREDLEGRDPFDVYFHECDVRFIDVGTLSAGTLAQSARIDQSDLGGACWVAGLDGALRRL